MPKVAKTTCRVAGFRAMLQKGKVYEDNDPVVKARPELFQDPVDHARQVAKPTNTDELGSRSMSARKKKKSDVEQATAAPGEQRNVKRKKSDDDS